MLQTKDRTGKELVLNDLDLDCILGQWRPSCYRAPLPGEKSNSIRLIYERKDKHVQVQVTAVAILLNESTIIHRMLQSMVPWTQACIILDTGSNDDTLAKVQQFMEEQKWVGKLYQVRYGPQEFQFDIARTAVLELAHAYGEWLALTDADYVWKCSHADFLRSDKYKDIDVIHVATVGGTVHSRPHLIRSHVKCRFVRATHEYLEWQTMRLRHGRTDDLRLEDLGDGGSKHDKLLRDIYLLKNRDMPKYGGEKDARSWFYYACTLNALPQHELAYYAFLKRLRLGGWDQENYLSSFYSSRILYEHLAGSLPLFLRDMLDCFLHTPRRVEPLFAVLHALHQAGEYELASSVGCLAYENRALSPTTDDADLLFVNDAVQGKEYWHLLCTCLTKTRQGAYFEACLPLIKKHRGVLPVTCLHEFLDAARYHATTTMKKKERVKSVKQSYDEAINALQKNWFEETRRNFRELLAQYRFYVTCKEGTCLPITEETKITDGELSHLLSGSVWLAQHYHVTEGSQRHTWLSYVLDTIKLNFGRPANPLVANFVVKELHHTCFDVLTGTFLILLAKQQ